MDRRDVLAIVLAAALGLVGLGVFLHYYTQAFPAASLDFKLSREDAYRAAGDFLASQGHDTEGYESAQVFAWNQMSQTFLERTLGLEETNRLAREWVSIWSWRVRWFRPLQKEEFRVALDPGGRVVSYGHRILESDEGAMLDQAAAQVIADRFITESQGFDLADFELIEQSSKERKARMDHTFTYRKQGFTVGEDGHYRLKVVIQGDRVGAFSEGVKVPESFSRDFAEVRSRANLLTGFFQVFWLALGVAALVILLQYHRRGLLEWQAGTVIGAMVLIATIVGALNTMPLFMYGFNTTQTYVAFVSYVLLAAVFAAALQGGAIAVVGTSGNAMGRQTLFGGLQSPLGRVRLGGVLTRGFLRSTVVGYGIAGCMLGYITVWYLIGTRFFGLYAPAHVSDYDNAFSTALPWIYPLLVGLSAAALEEFFFRLLAISLLLKWLKRRWLAVVIPGVIWAFLHSNYPVEPIYMRGIELTVVGILFGVAFLRFGIWAPIVAHYAYNAFLTAFPMIKSSSTYFQVSGVVVTVILLLPAIPALVALILGKARDEVDEPQAEDQPTAPREPAEQPGRTAANQVTDEEDVREPAPPADSEQTQVPQQKELADYIPGSRQLVIACVFAVAGLMMAVGFRVERLGSRTLTMRVTRSEAIQVAETFCRNVGLDTEGYRRSVKYRSYVPSSNYIHLARNAGVARADTLMYENTGPWLWNVRWFKPLEKEEIQVGVDAVQERVLYFEHKLAESTPGDSLGTDEARAMAETFAAERFGRDVADGSIYKLLDAQSQKREARLDHSFAWEKIDRKVEDGEFRVEVRVQGDQIGRVVLHYKAPEAFIRDLQEQTARDVIGNILPVLLVVATVILGVVFFFRAHRQDLIVWRFPFLVGGVFVLMFLVDQINGIPAFYHGFKTSQAMGTFLGFQAVGILVGSAFIVLALAVGFALLLALYRSHFPQEISPDRWVKALWSGMGSPRYWTGTLVLAAAFALFGHGTSQLGVFARYNWFLEYLKPGDYAMVRANNYLPFLNGVTNGITSFLAPLLVVAVLLIWFRTAKKGWILVVGLLAAMVLQRAVVPSESIGHFSVLLAVGLVSFLPTLYLVIRVIRFNLMAYMIGGWWGRVLIAPGLPFQREGVDASAEVDGLILFVIGLAPLLLPLIAYFRRPVGDPAPRPGG